MKQNIDMLRDSHACILKKNTAERMNNAKLTSNT